MWRLFLFLLFLIVSVWGGLEIIRHPGYLYIVYQSWLIQMPLWFALLSSLIFLLLFYFIINSIDRLHFLWIRFKNWLHFRRTKQSYSKTQEGLAMLIEGRWKKSEQLLLAGCSNTQEPLINYLGAAKAAHELAAYERRDNYIQKAYRIAPHNNFAIGLTQANLEIASNQLEHALATLTFLQQSMPYHPQILKLLEKIYIHRSDWKNLHLLVPHLRKAKMITTEQAEQFEKNLYCEVLRSTTHQSIQEVHSLWYSFPRNAKKNPEVVYEYIKLIHSLSSSVDDEIEALIRKVLKYHWHALLVVFYGTLNFSQLNRQLVIVGAWFKMYGPHPELFLTLARLCVRVQLWGKAKDYFEKCLALGPYPEAALDYGKLLEQLGHSEEAAHLYKNTLLKCAKNTLISPG